MGLIVVSKNMACSQERGPEICYMVLTNFIKEAGYAQEEKGHCNSLCNTPLLLEPAMGIEPATY